MAILRTEAIVLRTFDFRETSLIANFFTQEYGRIDGLLKGIRCEPKKFASTLEPFSCNEIIFYQKRSSQLHLISQCDLSENFNNVRKDVKSVAHACYIVDLIQHLMPQEEKNEEVYKLTLLALKQIDGGKDAEKALRIFIIKFLKLIGFRPRLEACIACDKNIAQEAYFNVRRGGLLCANCNNSDNYSTGVLKGTVASILHIETSNWQDALRLGLNARVREELHSILHNFMEFHLQIRPKSQELLEVLQ